MNDAQNNLGERALHAIRDNDIYTIKSLVSSGYNINSQHKGLTPLFFASASNNISIVNFLLSIGANVNQKIVRKGIVMNVQIRNHKAHFQIEDDEVAGINVSRNFSEMTSLGISSLLGHESIVQCLINAGANVNETYEDGASPVYLASKFGHHDIVQILINEGANINIQLDTSCFDNRNAIHNSLLSKLTKIGVSVQSSWGEDRNLSFVLPDDYDLDKYFQYMCKLSGDNDEHEGSVYDINTTSSAIKGFTPLMIAIQEEHWNVVNVLLENNCDVNLYGNGGISSLMLSSAKGNEVLIDALIERGARIEDQTNFCFTALCFATIKGNNGAVKKLIKAGANVNFGIGSCDTPLLLAVQANQNEIVKTLIQNGSDVNCVGINGVTPMITASLKGCVEIVKALISAGASVNKVNMNDGSTALMAAAQNKYLNIVKILLANGADVNVKMKGDGPSALCLAIQSVSLEIVNTLLEAGANPHSSVYGKWSPLQIAEKYGNVEIIEAIKLKL